ncbi:MAG TPA: dihydrolipoamide acetyltransferase family protein [Gaiellaceae bacterium]|nr:dihydrolipoamide acetyltransferase family protein [Gaiellaceae bacterium]
MARELTMPKLSDSMAEAVIIRWLVSPGEAFDRGAGLVEVETDKATVVYEAEAAGTLDSILVPEGASAAIGDPIATLANGAGEGAQPQVSDGKRPNATPVARRKAVELGVSLHGLAGTGPGGRITQEDVERAAGGPGEPTRDVPAEAGGKGEVETVELTATQATIARRMEESAKTIPVFTVSADVDMSLIAELRRGAREERDDAPSLNDFVVKAAASVLRAYPRFNASFAGGRIECYSRINVAVAVATDDALLVPVVRDADRKTLAEIAAETRRLAEGARSRSLRPDDLADGTFTVSNLGMFGVRSFTAIVDPPQVGILAVGGIRRAPVEDADGGVVFRDLMSVTLSCDHRAVYGADGAQFLSRLRELLERPLALTL